MTSLIAEKIYVLRDPRDGMARWVGCSIDPERRLAQHLRGQTPKSRSWCFELRGLDLAPLMSIHDCGDDWREAEKAVWDHLIEEGHPLLNRRPRGERPVAPGQRLSAERKEHIRLGMLGKQNSLGYRHTPEAKEKNRQASLGNTYGLGHYSGGMTGKKHSPEWVEWNSQRHLGNQYALGKDLGNKHAVGKRCGVDGCRKLIKDTKPACPIHGVPA